MEIHSVEPTPTYGISGAPSADAHVDPVRPVQPVSEVKAEGISINSEAPKDAKEISKEQVKRVADSVNTVLAQSGNHLRFVMNDDTKKVVVQVRDDKTDTVIRTIPSKEFLDLSAKIGDLIGMLMDEKT